MPLDIHKSIRTDSSPTATPPTPARHGQNERTPALPDRGAAARHDDARISALRLMCLLAGYVVIGMATLSLLRVSVTHLLLGGVLTGVILGIAAQQALGNTFAGLVLLFARPFNIGSPVTIRSGALGGRISGVVTGMTLTYVTLRADRGVVLLPNSAVLAAAIGPDAAWEG